MATDIIFNGRFLTAPPSGVQRVAGELIQAVGRRFAKDPELAAQMTGRVLGPKGMRSDWSAPPFPVQSIGRLPGQAWEQVTLPRHAKGSFLVNLCNLAPLWHTHGLVMLHDAQVFSTPGSYSRAFRTWYQFAFPRFGKHHSKVLTVSDYSKTELVHYKVADPENIAVIHNGADHILRHAEDRSILDRLDLKENGFTLGLANTQTHKNIRVILEAHADPRLADRKLVLFGSATRQKFEDLGIAVPENVIFAGFIDDVELRSLYSTANALLFPSLTEGFGLPPLEALTLGTPTICAPCGALPEVAGPASLFADEHTPQAWTSAILELAQEGSDARDTRCESARTWAKKFTWDIAAGKLIDQILMATSAR